LPRLWWSQFWPQQSFYLPSPHQLQQDIARIEREIVERGRFSVEDATSVGVGLQFGIENVETKAEALAKAKAKNGKSPARTSSSSMFNESTASDTEHVSQSTSKLVFLKFRRLDQLIYILKRKLSVIENYPRQQEIDRKYGSIDGLVARCDALETENARLESRLSSGALKYNEDALLRVRNLNRYPPAFLHLLIVSLQQTLVSYMRAVEDTIGVGKDFSNAKHPLYPLVKSWSIEVEKETRKLEITKKKKTPTAKDHGVMHLDSGKAKLDIDEMYQSMLATKKPTTQEQKENITGGKVLRAAGTVVASKESASSIAYTASNLELSSELSSASLQIQSLEFENDLLRREVRNFKWMEGVLKREGIIANRSGSDCAPTVPSATEDHAHATLDQHDAIHVQTTTTLERNDTEEEKEQQAAIDAEQQDQPAEGATPISSREEKFAYPNDLDTDAQTKEEADADAAPPTVLRSITITAPPPSSVPSSCASSSGRLSSVSRSLLAHLQSYAGEVERYRAFILQYQKLHVSRERALQTAEHEKGQLVKIMLHLVKKFPQLHDVTAVGGATKTTNAKELSHRGGANTPTRPGSRNLSRRPSITQTTQ
jgi:hypothetical protein